MVSIRFFAEGGSSFFRDHIVHSSFNCVFCASKDRGRDAHKSDRPIIVVLPLECIMGASRQLPL